LYGQENFFLKNPRKLKKNSQRGGGVFNPQNPTEYAPAQVSLSLDPLQKILSRALAPVQIFLEGVQTLLGTPLLVRNGTSANGKSQKLT